jgi:hypothetical protein
MRIIDLKAERAGTLNRLSVGLPLYADSQFGKRGDGGLLQRLPSIFLRIQCANAVLYGHIPPLSTLKVN